MKRNLVPRALPSVTPATVSQLTSIHVLGMDQRRFLEDLVPRCAGVSHVGRLRLVPLDEALRVLREFAPAANDLPGSAPSSSPDAADGSLNFASADDFLAHIGRRRKSA